MKIISMRLFLILVLVGIFLVVGCKPSPNRVEQEKKDLLANSVLIKMIEEELVDVNSFRLLAPEMFDEGGDFIFDESQRLTEDEIRDFLEE